MKRPQATKASTPAVQLHIQRQRALGENLIPGNDRPRLVEILAVSAVVIAALAVAAHRGWFHVVL